MICPSRRGSLQDFARRPKPDTAWNPNVQENQALGTRHYRLLLASFCSVPRSQVTSHKRGSGHVAVKRSDRPVSFVRSHGCPCPCGQQGSSETTRKVTNRVVPGYPELARAMNVRGIVRLEVLVAPNGTVKSVKVIGGHPVLVQAAERAVQKWKWERVEHESNEAIELRFNPE